MLEVTGSIAITSQVNAAVTLAKCASGSIDSVSVVTVTEAKITVHNVTGNINTVSTVAAGATLGKCVAGNIDAVSTVAATSTKWKPGAGTITAKSTVQGIMVKGDPVGNPTQLSNIRNSLAKEYVLLDNIDLSGIANWEPIGTTPGAPFTGILNGNGFTISNLAIDRQTTDYIGLFGYCQFDDAEKIPNLRNLVINNANIKGQDYVGALAGYVETTLGAVGNAMYDPPVGILIDDCSVSGTVSGRNKVGGVLGMAKGPQFAGHIQQENIYNYMVWDDWIAKIEGCFCEANVIGSGENIGGIVGELYEITVNMSNTTGILQGGDKIGGIAGSGYRCAIRRSYSTGTVTGIKIVGGIIGYAIHRPRIEKCYSEGAITGTGGTYPGQTNAMVAGVGGIAGYTDLEYIAFCFSKGNITAVWRAGGIVGSCAGGDYCLPNFNGVYARGNVSVSGGQVGGLVGFLFAGIVEFSDGYCTGSVTGPSAGAIIGARGSYIDYGEEYAIFEPNWNKPVGEVHFITDCFFNTDTNTASSQFGGVGKTSTELQVHMTYETSEKPFYFFDRFWVIDDEEGDIYPQFLVFYEPYGVGISVIRGVQGLILSYVKSGEVFYRQLSAGTWGAETQVTNFAEVNTLNLFRTRDNRIGFVADENERIEWAITAENAMNIAHTKTLTQGLYGDILHTPDNEVYLFYISDVGNITQLKGEFTGDWNTVEFGLADPMPSDSQITRFRAKIYGSYGYLVWRSRGQHRLMKVQLAKPIAETFTIRNGSISMSLDSPIISAQMEFDEGLVI